MRSPLLLAPLFLVVASGCTVAEDDPRSLGRFEVAMTQTESCGEGVLIETPAEQTMTVYLRRPSSGSLLWVEREGVFGLTMNPDGTFRGDAWRTATFGEGGDCRLSREDVLEGDFGSGDLDGVASFRGTMVNTFSALEDADCTDAMEASVPLADVLPCTLAYDLDAQRIE